MPWQHSSGGKSTLLGISKRGDRYLRTPLVHGARSVIVRVLKRDDEKGSWLKRTEHSRLRLRVTEALALVLDWAIGQCLVVGNRWTAFEEKC